MTTWEDPPRRQSGGHGGRDAPAVAADLKANRGQWAIFRTYSTRQSAGSDASQLKSGRYHWAPKGSVEAVSRTVDGEFRVYARWVGPS